MLVVGATLGCANIKDDAKRTALQNSLDGYRQAIRWGYFPAAAGFLSPDAQSELETGGFDNVRVTGYEVIRPARIDEDDTAVQLVQIDYVLEDRQRLEQLIDRQRWRYEQQSGSWWLDSGLPRFRDPHAAPSTR
jgi:hypothetical protein